MWLTSTGRGAALIYCIAGLSGVFSYMYVPGAVIVSDVPSATAANILGSEMLFRFGIVGQVISSIALLFTALVLYRLLHRINETLAKVMVILVIVAIPVVLLNAVNHVAALRLVSGPDYLSALDTSQSEALAMLFLRMHTGGLVIAQIFWGLWLIPFGMLVMRSGFIPRILGILLIVNGVTYPLVSLTWLLLPSYATVATQLAIIPELGELWIILWLLIKNPQVQTTSASTA